MTEPHAAVEPDFIHRWPESTVVFGPGTLRCAADRVRDHGAKALLITDPAAASAADVIAADLDGAGSAIADRIDEVVMHVPPGVIAAAAERARRVAADVVVCVGGGSSTGLAKGIARDLQLPIVAVPTTYAGSEMTSIWGSTDNGRKTAARAEIVRPRTVVYDPELTVTLPVGLSVTSGINAIAHSVEALYSPRPSPMTQLLAIEGIRAMRVALPAVVRDPVDIDARSLALRGAWLSGFALEVSAMSVHHKVCHVLGGLLDLPHSPLHTVVLPYAVAYTAPYAPREMQMLTTALGTNDPADVAGAIWDLAAVLGAPTSLAAIGLDETDLERAVEYVVARCVEAPPTSPRPLSTEALGELVRAAWFGERPARCDEERR